MARHTLWAASLALLLLFAAPAQASTRTGFVFFEGTQYPLPVVFVHGDAPGPTVMVQGGIQGDEPTGFLAAQYIAESHVLKGNLIVVPRANVPSIHVHKRVVNVDMNRRFDRDYNQYYEDRLARVVRFLLSQSSALIHLHEGSGFYDPTYVNKLRNPQRWGQSVIIDASVHDRLNLAKLVDDALTEINTTVTNPDYQFKLFDTRTFEPDSRYRAEMSKSLTYYALANLNIPAMAVEVSKNIGQLGWKVKHQVFAVSVLLRHCGVDIVPPRIDETEVERSYARSQAVTVNGKKVEGGSVDVKSGGTLSVEPAEKVDPHGQVVAVFASDRQGQNLVDAPRMALEPFRTLETRVDGRRVSTTTVRFDGAMPPPTPAGPPVFVCWLNGKSVRIKNGGALRAVAGDQFLIEGVLGSKWKEVLNLKGYTAQPHANDGQDMGWEIILDPDAFMNKYRLPSPVAGAVRYQVVRETRGARPASFFIDVVPRRVVSVKLVDAAGRATTVRWTSGGEVSLPPGEYTVAETASNGPQNRVLALAGTRPLKPGETFRVEAGRPLLFSIRQATTFAGLGVMTLAPGPKPPRTAAGAAKADAPATARLPREAAPAAGKKS